MSYQIKPWQDLTICDDYMFKLIMRRKRICKRMLEKILQVPIRDITYPEEEKNMKMQYDSKGIRLDVFVAGSLPHRHLFGVRWMLRILEFLDCITTVCHLA